MSGSLGDKTESFLWAAQPLWISNSTAIKCSIHCGEWVGVENGERKCLNKDRYVQLQSTSVYLKVDFAWFQAFAAVSMRSTLFCDVMQ